MKKFTYDGWEQPIPFDTVKHPVFPTDSLPQTVRDYVVSVAEATQTPVDMSGVSALAVMAGCVHGKFIVEAKSDWTEPLNLYCIIVANPAERKSAVLSWLTKYVNQYEAEWNERYEPKIEQNKIAKKCLEKEVERLADAASKTGDIKDMQKLMLKRDELTRFAELHKLRLLADDTTPEALITLMANNSGRMSVMSSEGGIFETMNGKYAQSVNMDVFLKGHNGDVIKIDRKGRKHESIEQPCLTVLLMVQPQVLEGLMSNSIFQGRGLTARFLYSIPTSMMGSRRYDTQPIPQRHTQEYKKLCYRLLDMPNDDSPKLLRLSEKADKLSADFHSKLEPRLTDGLENIQGFAGKLHGAVLRIAGIFHLIDGNTDEQCISSDTMRNAIRIGRYFLHSAKFAYKTMGADKQLQDAKYILKYLKRQNVTETTRYEIFRLCRGRFKKNEDMTPAVVLLEDYGYIRETETDYKNVGRKPSPKYEINPYLMD
jgi:hypothetical protein